MRRTNDTQNCTDKIHRHSQLVFGGFGASLAMACMATPGAAQDSDLIILPTVEVETTEEPTPQPAAKPAPRATQPAPLHSRHFPNAPGTPNPTPTTQQWEHLSNPTN